MKEITDEMIDNLKFRTKGDWRLKDFLHWHGTHVFDSNGRNAYFLPYWFEEVDGELEMHTLEKTPLWIKETIEYKREGK